MIAIIDYGMGNLKSVEKAFERVGVRAVITREKGIIDDSDGLVLPGVGAFGDAMANLADSGLDKVIIENVKAGKPLLGICLGMQLLMSNSEEGGLYRGLNLVEGTVVRFRGNLKVPQVGWNQIKIQKPHPLLEGIPDGSNFYFVHSYYVNPVEKEVEIALTDYETAFPSIIAKGNVYGIQFHPEKSSYPGLRILKNYGVMVGC
ncbi:Imidazole glycerol phosphate synthase subunit HisH [Koleobacter methoxysyntrophicus]|uniref:Imidazole glycerol phosphate synthase subunit HisH n=1 Tax=Koleobacter methoxysyntrophicus TaxID=2751313 RepID=A0A8A0RPW3_9FIRM|nr:imidazole glycerol phosphate synthase subunit HisH [Koleobacter methoxysyntrophicus]QSQ09620.1 Imidazole glycerol phosphate synthase subunit HisH [Koleobacter methoxysyntrophicus]